jgi:hypothetical protein
MTLASVLSPDRSPFVATFLAFVSPLCHVLPSKEPESQCGVCQGRCLSPYQPPFKGGIEKDNLRTSTQNTDVSRSYCHTRHLNVVLQDCRSPQWPSKAKKGQVRHDQPDRIKHEIKNVQKNVLKNVFSTLVA